MRFCHCYLRELGMVCRILVDKNVEIEVLEFKVLFPEIGRLKLNLSSSH